MTEKPDNQTELNDEQFEAYLDGNSPVSHAYREANTPAPPPALDRAILTAAEAALKPKRKNFLDWDMEFWRRWARPVSTVVIMGVSLAVVLQVMDIRPEKQMAMMDSPESANTLRKAPRLESLPQRELIELEEKKPAAQMMADVPPAAKAESTGRARMAREMRSPGNETWADIEADNSALMVVESFTAEAPAISENESAMYAAASIASGADSDSAATTMRLADNAMEEWDAGAQASADIWLAGIEAREDSGQAGIANNELTKMAQYYPKIVERYQQQKGFAAAARLDINAASDAELALERSPVTAQAAMADQTTKPLPNPDVWAAGIARLHAADSEQAAAERAKLLRIYPDYVSQ
jgi:hypothetical protein